MPEALFPDRRAAGRALAGSLGHLAGAPRAVVLGLPRGGVPVAAEVARALGLPLDALVVRKLGVPGHEELAMGAIAAGGTMVLNEDVVALLPQGEEAVARAAAAEGRELERRERDYRGGRGPVDLDGHTAILVDDGAATGASVRAAALVARAKGAERVVVALPVAPTATRDELFEVADEIVCAMTPEPFRAVGAWYEDFSEVGDEEVRALLDTRS